MTTFTAEALLAPRRFVLHAYIVAQTTRSKINIYVNDVDITDKVLLSSASFESQASALPGQFQFVVKDVNRTMEFNTGDEIRLEIDDVPMYGGLVMQIGRKYPFEVLDTSDITSVPRYLELSGADYNLWFDKRVIRNPKDYLHAIHIKGVHYDGWYIRTQLPKYIDVPDGVNMTTHVEDVEQFGSHLIRKGKNKGKQKIIGINLRQQGDTWRSQMDTFAARSAAVYYLDAEKQLHFHALETQVSPWALTDYVPDGTFTIGCRNVNASEDGSPMVNDALVWGGLQELASYQKDPKGENSGTFFGRYEDLDSQAKHGRWQYAEVDFQRGDNQDSVDQRAQVLVKGKYAGQAGGTQTGLAFPVWSITATWFAHDVPNRQHVRAGQVMNIFLYAMGKDRYHPLIQTLPLRSVSITFQEKPNEPNTAYVVFNGQFGIQYSDSRHMWRFLRNQLKRWSYVVHGDVNNSSDAAGYGAVGRFYPNEKPDGSRKTFTIPFSYISGTTVVELNGLRQAMYKQYAESDAEDGEITFYEAPRADDVIYVMCRTAEE